MEISSRKDDGKQVGQETHRTEEEKNLTKLSAVALVISLSLNVFLLASLATYGVWLASGSLQLSARGLVSFLTWIVCFGAGTLAFWKMVERLSPN